eukprot:scaffold217188_cov26-Tisochrysis_lutea.AAC.1
MPEPGYASRVRQTVSQGRSADRGDADPMRNLAYVVSSANDSISALQKSLKANEKELADKADQISALQRNYETLSRIRHADQHEFTLLKELHDATQKALTQAREQLDAERERAKAMDEQLAALAEERAELRELRLRVSELEREKVEADEAVAQERARVAEMSEGNRRLQDQIDTLGRAQAETLARAAKLDEACKQLESEKTAVEKAHVAAGSKIAVQERQLRTFLEANEVRSCG